MVRDVRVVALHVAICAVIGIFTTAAQAGTIIKLGLGGDPLPDVEFDGVVLSTVDDTTAATTGEQNTDVDYQDFLSSETDIPTSIASVTLDGITAVGTATVFPAPPSPPLLVIQNFSGGTISLYDAANTLLLSGALSSSTLTGTLGPPGTGALFTTTFSTVTGGTLAPQILPNSLTLSMSFSDVNGGAGFSVTPSPPAVVPPIFSLNPFTADATANIAGEVVPEPAAALLMMVGAAVCSLGIRRPTR